MTNLSFDTGTYKEYSLNGGETIRINVGDWNIVERLKAAGEKIDQIIAEMGTNSSIEMIVDCDKRVRNEIDKAISCPGACDKAFGQISSIGIAENGNYVALNFVLALVEQLGKDMKQKLTIAAINESVQGNTFETLNNERTQKYITQTQNKPQIEQTSATPKGFNLATLSQEEREKLLAELIGEPK